MRLLGMPIKLTDSRLSLGLLKSITIISLVLLLLVKLGLNPSYIKYITIGWLAGFVLGSQPGENLAKFPLQVLLIAAVTIVISAYAINIL